MDPYNPMWEDGLWEDYICYPDPNFPWPEPIEEEEPNGQEAD